MRNNTINQSIIIFILSMKYFYTLFRKLYALHSNHSYLTASVHCFASVPARVFVMSLYIVLQLTSNAMVDTFCIVRSIHNIHWYASKIVRFYPLAQFMQRETLRNPPPSPSFPLMAFCESFPSSRLFLQYINTLDTLCYTHTTIYLCDLIYIQLFLSY